MMPVPFWIKKKKKKKEEEEEKKKKYGTQQSMLEDRTSA